MEKCKAVKKINVIYAGRSGFTLVEVLVAMSLIMLVIFAYTIFFTSSFEGIFKAGEKSERLFTAQEDIENLIGIRDEGSGDVLELTFNESGEYDILGRKQVADSFTTFLAEETPAVRFVAVGNIVGKLLSSPLGTVWEEYDSNVSYFLHDVTWGGKGTEKYYVAVGQNGKMVKSKDGKLWLPVGHGITTDNLNAVIWGGIWGDGIAGTDGVLKYIAVGNKNQDLTKAIIYSEDSDNWSSADYNYSDNLNGVCWGFTGDYEGYFVAVGDNGRIVTSLVKDDTFSPEWEGIDTDNSEKLNDIIWADGIYAAVGDSGTILLSTDAQNWTIVSADKKPADFNTNLNSITSNANVFVAVGDYGKILVSEELSVDTKWNEPTKVPGTAATLNAVTWSYNRFIAVGDGIIYTSVDGAEWIKIEPRQGDNWDTYNLKGITGR